MIGSVHRNWEASRKRAVLYLRVSTLDQTTANQDRELRQVAERAGWQIVHVYKDHGISGAKGKDKRPAFDALHKAAARREFDVVMAWSVDRLGRSLQDLVGFLSEIHAAGVDLFLHQQGIDTTTPGGKAMFQMLGVFAEFERSIVQERVRAGLRRAVSEGKKLGRPRIAADMEARILAALTARKDTGDSGRACVERAADTLHRARIDAEPCRDRPASAPTWRPGVCSNHRNRRVAESSSPSGGNCGKGRIFRSSLGVTRQAIFKKRNAIVIKAAWIVPLQRCRTMAPPIASASCRRCMMTTMADCFGSFRRVVDSSDHQFDTVSRSASLSACATLWGSSTTRTSPPMPRRVPPTLVARREPPSELSTWTFVFWSSRKV